LTPEVLAKADPGQGRIAFNTVCANCHRLYGHGGEIGPDLTGAGRQTAKELQVLDRGDIETIEVSSQSLMPDGLLQPLKPDQLRDLVAYLMTRSQVALPEGLSARADIARPAP
jgi:mono/diheme cytochrome c family protein